MYVYICIYIYIYVYMCIYIYRESMFYYLDICIHTFFRFQDSDRSGFFLRDSDVGKVPGHRLQNELCGRIWFTEKPDLLQELFH